MGAVKRAVSGASIMMTTYTAEGGPGSIAFASKFPGHILPIDVAPGNEFMVHRHGFMAATPGIELSMGFQQSFRGGVFGGEGFILQKIGGSGRAFVDLSGEVIVYDLAAGQTMRVHPGHAGLFQASVTFSVQKVPGLANRYMGAGRAPLRRPDRPGPDMAAVDAAADPRRCHRRVPARPGRPPWGGGCSRRHRWRQDPGRPLEVVGRPRAAGERPR